MKPAYMQIVGMLGLTQSVRRTFGWALRLMFCRIERRSRPWGSAVPMRSVVGGAACHAPAETEVKPARRGRAVALPVAS